MKHNVTPINGENEPLTFVELMFDNWLLETQLGCYLVQPTPTPPETQLGLLPFPTDGNETCTTHCNISSSSSSNTSASNGLCTDELWTMYFDGSKTQDASGARCVLIDPKHWKHLISSLLEFECTKNISQYEALVLGLQKAISLNITALKVVGDAETLVRQVRNTIHFLSHHLKSYQKEVWTLISNFQAFNIIVVPRMRNAVANTLTNAVASMSPLRDKFTVKSLYKPFIPDNITNLRAFGDDQQILHFMDNVDAFEDATVNEDEHEQSLQVAVDEKKGNLIPKGVVSLKRLYDLKNHFQQSKKRKTHSSTMMNE